MLSKEDKRCLVVGIGNPLRSDDGVGPCIVHKIEEKNIPGVNTLSAHQLNVELLEEVGGYQKVLLVDASYSGDGLSFRKVIPINVDKGASSHHFSPEFFLALSKKLYQRDLNLFLYSIRGRNFDIGGQLSPDVMSLVPKAVDEICACLKEN